MYKIRKNNEKQENKPVNMIDYYLYVSNYFEFIYIFHF